MHDATRWRRTALCAALAPVALGCSESTTPSTPLTCIVVNSEENTNAGLPLHMLVRSVDEKTYREESYASAAAKVTSPDETVLGRAVVFAGIDRKLAIRWPDEDPVGVYFLFTAPGGDFRKLVTEPAGTLQIELGTDRILTLDSGEDGDACEGITPAPAPASSGSASASTDSS